MSDFIRIYREDSIETAPLDGTREVSCGEGEAFDHAFPKGSCGGSAIRFVHHGGRWQVFCTGTVRCGGRIVTQAEVQDGDLFVLNNASRLAVQFFRRTGAEAVRVPLSGLAEVRIGRGKSGTVELAEDRVSSSHAKLYPYGGDWRVCDLDSTNGTFLNGKRVREATLREGDVVMAGSYELLFSQGALHITGGKPGSIRVHLPERPKKTEGPPALPVFSRSPRLIREKPSGSMEIEAAPAIGSKPEINWLTVLLPVVASVVLSLAMALFTGGLGMILSVPMMLAGVLVTWINYRSQSKKYEQTERTLQEKYRQYIASCEARLEEAARQQRAALLDANPSPEQCRERAEHRDARLWERRADDADFLALRAGLGQEPLSLEIRTPKVGFVLEENDFTRMPQQTAERYRTVEGVPVLCELANTAGLGIVGSRGLAVRMAQSLLVQAAALHGYDDLRIAVFFPQEERESWEWARWLPHVLDDDRTHRRIACTRYDAAQIFTSLEPVFRRRQTERESAWGAAAPKLPHYLFLFADPGLLAGQPLAEELLRGGPALGATCSLLGTSLQDLPGSVSQILEARGAESVLYHRERPGERRAFAMDQLSLDGCDAFARALAPLRLPEQSAADRLPDSVTFLDGYHVRRPEELDFADYWANSCSFRSLAVPIGVKAGGATYTFDIHEKKSGPHGLVAGTNGSGKSEMAQSWIASMAVQFSPRDVNFVLVDFKGTSLLQPFRALPHLAGSISNLDRDIRRCLLALDNEMERRQILVDRCEAHDILGYQALRRKHPEMEEMPFLFLVIDEFADFKAQFPDFTGPLNHIFRGGRALGIYTVIMTQKPSGVVTEQMAANATFRWCLRVVSESDSREMIGCGDAAYLKHPGRAYVKIGTAPPELVQPFYSGAPYYPEGTPKKAPPTVSRVMLAGGRQLVAGVSQANRPAARGTQLQAVVQSIADHCRRSGIAPARRIWNEPLPEKLDLARLLPGGRFWESAADWPADTRPPAACLGLVDDPANQKQDVLTHDFWRDGHLLVYGMPLSGKTTLLQTLTVSLCSSFSPAQVQLFLAEFGGFGLRAMERFPHVGAAAGDDEPDRLRRIASLFLEELGRRKKLLREAGAGTIAALDEAGEKVPPTWVLAADNLNLAGERLPELTDALEQITREGEAFGLVLAATVTGTSGLSYRLAQNCKTVLALQLADRTDYASLVGRPSGDIPKPVIGRGLVKGPLEFHTAIAFPELSDGKRAAALRGLAQAMADAWQGPAPSTVRAMPQQIPFGSVPGGPLALGLSEEDVSPVCLPLAETASLLVSGGSAEALDSLLALLLAQLEQTENAQVLLCSARLSCRDAVLQRDPAGLNKALDAIVPELKRRQAARRAGSEESFPPLVIVLDGLDFVSGQEGLSASLRLEAFIRLGAGLNLSVIAAGDAKSVEYGYYSKSLLMETLHEGPILLAGGAAADHRIVDTAALARRFPEPFGPEQLILVRDGAFLAVRRMRVEP